MSDSKCRIHFHVDILKLQNAHEVIFVIPYKVCQSVLGCACKSCNGFNSGTREVAKPAPKKPKEGEEQAAPTVIHKPPPKESLLISLIDRQLHEDSLCSKMAQFFRQVRIRVKTVCHDFRKSEDPKMKCIYGVCYPMIVVSLEFLCMKNIYNINSPSTTV